VTNRHPFSNVVPRLRSTHVPRPRVTTLLSEIPDFPVTVVKAGGGYGKTTAVGNYVQRNDLQTEWLTLREDDRYGARFVERMGQTVLPADVPDIEREKVLAAGNSPVTWLASAQWMGELIATFVHDECIFVLDDFHVVDDDVPVLQWIDVWLKHLPPNAHVVFVTRTSPTLTYLESLINRGEVLWVRERELAFTADEVGLLFHDGPINDSSHIINRNESRWLVQRTGGMAMVLSMLLRDWRQHGDFARLQEALQEHTSIQEQVGRLFVYNLAPRYQEALLKTCVFTTLHPALCDEVLNRKDSAKLLLDMERKGYLTISEDGNTYELHPLVREYLGKSLSLADREELAERAIAWHLLRGEESKAIPYLFSLSDDNRVVAALVAYIPAYLLRGEVSTVQGWLERLPPRVVATHAGLLVARAEVDRQANRFAQAIQNYDAAYALAERQADQRMLAQVEMGRARLYLDTVQPGPAAHYIRQARHWVGQSDTSLRYSGLQLEFENCINQGRIVRAKRIGRALTSLPGAELPNNNSEVRLLLRCGEIQKVISVLKPRISSDLVGGRNALSHREATLLLALMYAMYGDAKRAKEQALRGHGVGHSLSAPFVSAVGQIRLGHAEHLLHPLGEAALTAYQGAISSMDEMEVPRGKAEALLGLCLAHGHRHQFGLAKSYAEQGIAISERAGDTWMANLVRLAYAQVAVVNAAFDVANHETTIALAAFTECGDKFLETCSRLWRSVARFHLAAGGGSESNESPSGWSADFAATLTAIERHDWQFLLERPTLCGVHDVQSLVPLLQRHRTEPTIGQLATRYLRGLQSESIDNHPGYTLRVQTLGRFVVWRGFTEMTRRDWQREKARQLFQFLLTHRHTLLHREEICERLWGDIDADTAERDFKVALTVLSSAIEPTKPGRGPSSFVVREGSLYGLTNHPMLLVDRDEFIQTIRDAELEPDVERRQSLLAEALSMYHGQYLSEVVYETWCDAERDKLQRLFIQAALSYAKLCFDAQRYAEVIMACERIHELDVTWEEAYLWLMRTYAAQFNRSMVMHTYRTCERVLQQELGINPMDTTSAAYRAMLGSDA